jgi:hypothetical protein
LHSFLDPATPFPGKIRTIPREPLQTDAIVPDNRDRQRADVDSLESAIVEPAGWW